VYINKINNYNNVLTQMPQQQQKLMFFLINKLGIEAKKSMTKADRQEIDRTLDFHLPPIETFMGIPAKMRKESAFQVLLDKSASDLKSLELF
jgi:hypothetical protein